MTTGNEVLAYFGYKTLPEHVFVGMCSKDVQTVIKHVIKRGLILFGEGADGETIHGRIAEEILDFTMYEYNDPLMREMVKILVKIYLENNGVCDYTMVCDGRNNTPELINNRGFSLALSVYWNGAYISREITIRPPKLGSSCRTIALT